METLTPGRAMLAGIIFGLGLDFCARQYLHSWYQNRNEPVQCTRRTERNQTKQSTQRAVSPNQARHPASQPPKLYAFKPARVTKDDTANGFVLSSNMSRKVLKIGSDLVVKFGPGIDLTEAQTMMFIRDNTTIPVPRILDAYHEDGSNYMVMEYMEGTLLKYAWAKMSEAEQAVIIKEMRDYVGQMRRIPAPKDVLIGSVSGGPAIDRRQFDSATGGPFRSENDFNEWQLAQLHPEVSLLSREMYGEVHSQLNDHQILFTHGDLAFHNIIVKDGHVNAIIDWEYSGWYPEHWDYCKTLRFLAGTDEEYLICNQIYEKQYHHEFFLQMWFGREILHGGF